MSATCKTVPLILLLLASCVMKPRTAVAPAAPVIAAPLPIIGHLPMPGQVLKPGRTNVYANRTLVGYLVYDPALFASAPNAPSDTGIALMPLPDNFGRRAIGDLQWCVSQFPGVGLTVVDP